MGPGVGAQRRGPVPEGCLMKSIMTALAPIKSRHPRLGQSLWWLWVMRPQCLHAHASPAGVLVCPAGRPGEASLPSVASSPRAGGRTGSGRRTPLECAPPPPHRRVCHAPFGGWGLSPLPPTWSPLAGSTHPQAAQWVGARPAAGGHITGTRGCPWCPRAQQYRTPLCASAHALHGGCPCASHTHVLRRRLCVSGQCCRVHACCGVKCMVCGSWLPFSSPVSTT